MPLHGNSIHPDAKHHGGLKGTGRLAITLLGAFMGVGSMAEIPAEQVVGVYASTNPGHRNLSPLWGMVALNSGVLANIRFFGAYASVPREHLPPLAPHYDCPQDATCAVLQYLFPSPDGINFVHNELAKDPIGQIASEARENRKRGGGPGGLKKILALLDAVTQFKLRLSPSPALGPTAGKGPIALGTDGPDLEFREAVYRILDRAGLSAAAEGEGTAFNRLRRQFSALLQQAILDEVADTVHRYPPDLVEVSLLAYAWKAADKVDELYEAFGGELLAGPEARTPPPTFDERTYRAQLPGFLSHLEEASESSFPGPPPSPEDLALFLYGHQAFEASIPVFVPYRTTTYRKDSFPDCGETSLRNFFITVFRSGGMLSDEIIEHFIAKFPSHRDRESKGGEAPVPGDKLASLHAYFRKYPALSQQGSEEAHADWSEMVSNLNAPGDRLRITYRNKDTHNLQGIGIQNMLNLVAHILPDAVLETPWPAEKGLQHDLVQRKLTRLCELASREGFQLEWSHGGKKIDQDFVTIDFLINKAPAFSWSFSKGHFSINPWVDPDAASWVSKVRYRPMDAWAESYLQHCRNGTRASIVLGHPRDIYTYSLTSLGEALRMVEAIVPRADPEYFQTLNQIIKNRIPFDFFALNRLAQALFRNEKLIRDRRFYPLSLFQGKPQSQKDEVLKIAVDLGSLPVARLLLDHGANANARDAGGKPLLIDALFFDREAMVEELLRAGADPNTRGPTGSPALAIAVVWGLDASVKALVKAGADLHATLRSGNSLLEVSKENGFEGITRFLERALEEEGETRKKARGASAGPSPIRAPAPP